MTKKDFMTFEEYKAALVTPKKEEPKVVELKSKIVKKEDENEPMVMDDAYETYKLEWMIENGYTIYDLIEAVVDFAEENKKMRDLKLDPSEVVVEWEGKAGFGDAIWDDYDTWLAGAEDDTSNGNLDELTEIVDMLDNGYASDEIESLGYDAEDIELAVQYSNLAPFTAR